MVAAVGSVRCGCKSSIPQKPECFWCHSEMPMAETQWNLDVNNYSHMRSCCCLYKSWTLLQKLRGFEPLSPSPLTKTQSTQKVWWAAQQWGSPSFSIDLCFTRMYIRSSLHPSRQLHDSFPYSGRHKCWVPQEIPISSPPEILHSLAQRSQHAASAYLWWGIAVVLRAAPEKSWLLLASSLAQQVFNTFLTSISCQNLEVSGVF